MPLREYLVRAQVNQAQFAARIGVPRQYVQRYCKGTVPEPKIMAKIVFATDGEVTANDFYGLAA